MCNLKELTAHAVERAGGQIRAAKILGASPQLISLWCIEGNERFIPLDHLALLNAASGDLILKTLARERGFDLTPRKVQAASSDNIFHIIGKFSKAAGALACVVLEAAHDLVFTPNERRRISHHIRPLKDCIDDVEHVIAK